MKSVIVSRFFLAISVLAILALPFRAQACAKAKRRSQPLSVDAYYVGLNAEKGPDGKVDPSVPQPEQIDYQAFSVLTYFGIMLNPDSSLAWPRSGQVCGDVASRTVRLAHAAGRKVLVSVGADPDPGETKNSRFRTAISDPRRAQFISGLLQILSDCDFDGIDLDWEPLLDDDAPTYAKFIHELRAALDAKSGSSQHLLLTAAVNSEPKLFAKIQGDFDQIDLMTYDLADESEGSPIWHNSALLSGDTESGQDPLPSADSMVRDFEDAGVAPGKLEIGIDFYGYLWINKSDPLAGLPFPGQVWKGVPDVEEDIPYSEIMDDYYQEQYAHWDDAAKSPYLSMISSSGYPEFLTYDDARACQEKIKYARSEDLAGVFIWELGGEWRPGSQVPNALLEAIKKAAFH